MLKAIMIMLPISNVNCYFIYFRHFVHCALRLWHSNIGPPNYFILATALQEALQEASCHANSGE